MTNNVSEFVIFHLQKVRLNALLLLGTVCKGRISTQETEAKAVYSHLFSEVLTSGRADIQVSTLDMSHIDMHLL